MDAKVDNKAILERSGLLKGNTAPIQDGTVDTGAASKDEGKGNDAPPQMPVFTGIPDGTRRTTEGRTETPPEDANLPEGSKKVVTQLRGHIKTLEGELRTLKAGTVSADEVKTLQEKLTKAYDQIAEIEVTRDPRFIEQFETPKEGIRSKMKDVIEMYGGVPADILAGIEGKPWKEQVEFLKENIADARPELIPLLKDYNAIDEQRASLLASKGTAKQQLIAQRQQAEAQVMQQAFDIVFKNEADANNPLMKEIPGEDEFNKNVTLLKKYAVSLDHSTPLALSTLKVKAAQAPMWQAMYQQSEASRLELSRQLKALGAALPSGNGSQSTPQAGVQTGRPMSAAEAAKMSASRLR